MHYLMGVIFYLVLATKSPKCISIRHTLSRSALLDDTIIIIFDCVHIYSC